MTDTNKNVGRRIKELRKIKNISCESMAESLNVSVSTYHRIENGDTNSWALHLDEISDVLKVPVEELIIDKNKHVQIVKEQSTGYLNSEVIIHNLSDKIIELYEARLQDKDLLIIALQKMLDKK